MAIDTGTETTRLTELGRFLRDRRARLRPENVGLPNGSRRRTPGLRREEVAQIADVGLTWYTWMEQGRDIHVSSDVLLRIARVLKLEPIERAHLFHLAGHEAPYCSQEEAVGPALLRTLELWEPFPAHVRGRRWDVLAVNRAYTAVYGDLTSFPEGRRNVLWTFFTDPRRKALSPDWHEQAEQVVALFRSEAAPFLDEPDYQELIAALEEASPEFAALWARTDVRGRLDGPKRLRHLELGELEFEHSTLQVADQPSLYLVLLVPAAESRTERVMRSSRTAPLDMDFSRRDAR